MKKWFNYKIPGQCEAIRWSCYLLMESALPFDYVEFDRSVETTGNYHSLVCTQHSSYVLVCYLPLTLSYLYM